MSVLQSKPIYKQIYVVDDDVALLQAVRQLLHDEGFMVKTAVSGAAALNLVRSHGLPHLLLVDLNLPGIDGFQLIQTVQQLSEVPAIMITAESQEAVAVKGLTSCLEDYIIKPFKAPELLSRVKRVLRRMDDYDYINAPMIYVDMGLQLDLPNRTVIINERPIPLSPTETKLLNLLINNAERTVSYQFLLRRLWPRDNAAEERLHTNIYRLRKKLENNPKEPKYIRSHWGQGYIFSWGNSES